MATMMGAQMTCAPVSPSQPGSELVESLLSEQSPVDRLQSARLATLGRSMNGSDCKQVGRMAHGLEDTW